MPSKSILWEPGAIYHITTRGNRKENIFREEEDFNKYLSILQENLIYYSYLNYKLIGYCLMSNHVHLIVQTDIEPLTRLMQRINSIYTRYFNKKYDYVGHLFQSSYYADLITNVMQLLEISRYAHLNPVKAKVVEKPEIYKWSSYPIVINERKTNLIKFDMIMEYFKNNSNEYKEFVESKIEPLGSK